MWEIEIEIFCSKLQFPTFFPNQRAVFQLYSGREKVQ